MARNLRCKTPSPANPCTALAQSLFKIPIIAGIYPFYLQSYMNDKTVITSMNEISSEDVSGVNEVPQARRLEVVCDKDHPANNDHSARGVVTEVKGYSQKGFMFANTDKGNIFISVGQCLSCPLPGYQLRLHTLHCNHPSSDGVVQVSHPAWIRWAAAPRLRGPTRGTPGGGRRACVCLDRLQEGREEVCSHQSLCRGCAYMAERQCLATLLHTRITTSSRAAIDEYDAQSGGRVLSIA